MWQLLAGSRSSVSSAETREGGHHFQIRTGPVTHPSEPPTMGYSTANDLTGWKARQKKTSSTCEYTHFLIWLQLILLRTHTGALKVAIIPLYTHQYTHTHLTRLIEKVLRSCISEKNKSQRCNRSMRRGREFFIPTFGPAVCIVVCFCWLVFLNRTFSTCCIIQDSFQSNTECKYCIKMAVSPHNAHRVHHFLSILRQRKAWKTR